MQYASNTAEDKKILNVVHILKNAVTSILFFLQKNETNKGLKSSEGE